MREMIMKKIQIVKNVLMEFMIVKLENVFVIMDRKGNIVMNQLVK